MDEPKTIDQKTTLWNNKMALAFAISLIIGTNAFNTYVQDIYYNKEQIKYNEGASKRRLSNAIKEIKLELIIETLEKELKYCKDKLK